jgi:subtilisin family serine protease
MRLADFTKRGAWPVATVLVALAAFVLAGLQPNASYARDDNKERKRAPVARAAKTPKVPQQGATTPRREGRARTPEARKSGEHDGERRRVNADRKASNPDRKDHEARSKDRNSRSKERDARSQDREKSKNRDAKSRDHDRSKDRDARSKGREKREARKGGDAKTAARKGPRGDRSLRRAVNGKTPRVRQAQRARHHDRLLENRARLPVRPYPGERGFTGVPPPNERRFITSELVFQAGPNVTQQQIDDMARRHNCVAVATQRSSLTGGTLIRFRIAGGQDAAEMVRAMEGERLGVAQPNYLYETAEQQQPAQQVAPDQYVTDKLKLAEVHKIATGKGILIAIIDSQVDVHHPELGSAVAESFDAVGAPDKPHTHGTGMLGAIASQGRLMGIAPGAKALAIHAFATGTQQSPQATTQAIIAGLEFAVEKGARIINMSFAGPSDPMLQVALKKAAEKGIVLVAAVGNAGPKSPPLYPAADQHVIGVTATDQNDELYSGANHGAYVALAAPGVNILAPAPDAAYQLTTGTSVAAAHVSGVVALLLERHPTADPALILEALTASATKLTKSKEERDDAVGFGLIDPAAALAELDERMAAGAVATRKPATAPTVSAARPAATPRVAPSTASGQPPTPVSVKRLPRPRTLPSAPTD